MPELTSFTLLYKRLLEANFEAEPIRVSGTLRALKRELFLEASRESDRSPVDFSEKNR